MSLLRRLATGTPAPTPGAPPAPAPPKPENESPRAPVEPPPAVAPPSPDLGGSSPPPAAPIVSLPTAIPASHVFRPEAEITWVVPDVCPPHLLELAYVIGGRLLQGTPPDVIPPSDPTTMTLMDQRFELAVAEEEPGLSEDEKEALRRAVFDEVFGYGPIQVLLDDERLTEVMVNGPKQIYVEDKGQVHETNVAFAHDDHVMRVIERIVRPLGRSIDRKKPTVDARLPDGSRVNAIIPPCALNGPTITIRKFSKRPYTVDDLIRFGSLTPLLAEFLEQCVRGRLNVIVSGGTGSGKTTLLNVLSGFIPDDDRIVTIEDSAELQLRQRHVVTLEAAPADANGLGQVTIRDLVTNSLRMRPERIVVGECRGGEAIDMLQAMNTGHDGSLTTLHANSPRDALARLETLTMMAGMDLPVRTIREQIASAIDLIVQTARLRDGSRKIVQVSEVQGMEGEVVVMQDVFVFREEGLTPDGRVIGSLRSTGIRPKFSSRLEAAGVTLSPAIFMNNF